MMGSEILEVAIGLVFIILIASLTATTVREFIEAALKTRAIQLERGLRQILDDPSGHGVTKELFNHPLLFSLFAGTYDPDKLRGFRVRGAVEAVPQPGGATATEPAKRMPFRSNLPSYIPSRNFALALLDTVGGSGAHGGPLTLDSVKANALALPDGRLKQALLASIGEAGNDIDRARTSLEAWFDGTMDRVSGWYKRETQLILLGIGLVIAVALNIDSLGITRDLATNNTLRQTLISRVDANYPSLNPGLKPAEADLKKQVGGLSDIIGWPRLDKRMRDDLNAQAGQDKTLDTDEKRKAWVEPRMTNGLLAGYVLWSIPGWLLTALAVSLGAPFWFDLLNKLMVIRATVKPYEKSPAEGSEDRRGARSSAERLGFAPASAQVQPGQQPQPQPGPQPAAAPLTTARLAIDMTGLDPGTLRLTCNGDQVAVPPDGFVELPLKPDEANALVAEAERGGNPVSWNETATPTRNDIGLPMAATLS